MRPRTFEEAQIDLLHAACEAKAAQQKVLDDETRLREYERRLVTGEPHTETQRQILAKMAHFQPAVEASFAEALAAHRGITPAEAAAQLQDNIVEEVENQLLGGPAPTAPAPIFAAVGNKDNS